MAERNGAGTSAGSHRADVSEDQRTAGPEAMRALVTGFIRLVHGSYLDQVRHLPPGERGALPLVTAPEVTVLAAAARQLHLVATSQMMPRPAPPEVAVSDELLGTRWTVRFFDPSMLPRLGVTSQDSPAQVRRVLGVVDAVYHLTVAPGGGLSEHRARHAGVALANLHAHVSRDLDRLRHALPHHESGVDELGACVRLGLHRAAGLLAADLTSGRVVPDPGALATECLRAVVSEVGTR